MASEERLDNEFEADATVGGDRATDIERPAMSSGLPFSFQVRWHEMAHAIGQFS
jgi:hypothetical protein